MHGLGVAVNTKLAWEYFARANFGSRHARLSRAEGAMLRLAKGVYEARAARVRVRVRVRSTRRAPHGLGLGLGLGLRGARRCFP